MQSRRWPRNVTNLGELLYAARQETPWTQPALAEELGIHQSALARYELGEREPSMKLLNTLRRVYGLTWDELLGQLR